MYADDTSITYASSDINDINKRLNYDLIEVYVLIDWWSVEFILWIAYL